MPPYHPKRLCLPLLLSVLIGSPALACTASRQLSELAQSYETLLTADSQRAWQDRAARLSQTLTTTDAATFGRDLDAEGAPADITRIARLFADASNLVNDTWNNRARHAGRTLENLTYADRLLTATNCDTQPLNLLQSDKRGSDATETANSQAEPPNPAPTLITRLTWPLAAAILMAFLGGAAARILRKGTFPKRHSNRLTRYPAVIPVLVAQKDGDCELADTADISLGGVRLAWKNAPAPGTRLTVDFSEMECAAEVIWSNAHFAGLRFDTQLTDDDLTRIRNRNNNP